MACGVPGPARPLPACHCRLSLKRLGVPAVLAARLSSGREHGAAGRTAAMGEGNGRVTGPRCIALVGPFASGKTSLLEAILARTGAITRQGTVAEKNTAGDASPEARAHQMSVEVNIAETDFMGGQVNIMRCSGCV